MLWGEIWSNREQSWSKLLFSGKKKKENLSCTETFLLGNWDDGRTDSWEGEKRMKAIQFWTLQLTYATLQNKVQEQSPLYSLIYDPLAGQWTPGVKQLTNPWAHYVARFWSLPLWFGTIWSGCTLQDSNSPSVAVTCLLLPQQSWVCWMTIFACAVSWRSSVAHTGAQTWSHLPGQWQGVAAKWQWKH